MSQPFQPLAGADYDDLKAAIKRGHFVVPVVKDKDGNIIDGHNRARACRDLGIDCPEIVVDATGPKAEELALVLNTRRRHLTPEQRQFYVRRLMEVKGIRRGQGARNDRVREVHKPDAVEQGELPSLDASGDAATIGDVADVLGVSRSTVERTLKSFDERESEANDQPRHVRTPTEITDSAISRLVIAVRNVEEKGDIANSDAGEYAEWTADLLSARRTIDQLLKEMEIAAA